MPLTNLPDQASSTLHTLPDGTSQWQVFPAPAFTEDNWEINDAQFLRDADKVSLEATGTEGGRVTTGSVSQIPIYLNTSSAELLINGYWQDDYVSTLTYQQNDIVRTADGAYWRSSGIATAADVPGVSSVWQPLAPIDRRVMWSTVNDGTVTTTSQSNGLAPQIYISDGATLETFNTTMEIDGSIVGNDLGSLTPYVIKMHETELYQAAPNAAGFFRVRVGALSTDSYLRSITLNGLEQGMYIYDPTDNSWGDALDNLELTVLRGGIIMDGGTGCLLYTSPSPRDRQKSRMPSSA